MSHPGDQIRQIHQIGQIREILRRIDAEEAGQLDAEASLQASGTLNSLQLLDLINCLEETFAIRIENAEVVPENLDSIAGILRFITAKRGANQVS